MKWQFLISLRYLLERRRERFISVTTLIAIGGIMLGVATLIVTMSIMNGFNNEIEEKILGVNPHIIIGSDRQIEDIDGVVAAVKTLDDVLATSEFMDGQALIKVRDKVMGILLRGVEPDPHMRLVKMEDYLIAGTLKLEGEDVLIGNELARNFRLKINDKVSVISPITAQSEDFKVSGIYKSGRYDYDLNLVFLNLKEAGKILGKENKTTGIGLKVDDVFNVDAVKYKIQSLLGFSYWVMTWKDIDRNLFSALKLEKIVMFILVVLIVLVACFNIISTLIMTVMEKTKDIGILKAIGATRFGIMSVFLLEGIYISLIGILAGAGLGLGICYLQDKYGLVKLPPDVYYIYSVPVEVRLPDTAAIIIAAFLLGLIAAVYPSLHAGRLNPIDAIRYE